MKPVPSRTKSPALNKMVIWILIWYYMAIPVVELQVLEKKINRLLPKIVVFQSIIWYLLKWNDGETKKDFSKSDAENIKFPFFESFPSFPL